MKTAVNPGSRLELEGSFALQRSRGTGEVLAVGDRETGRIVTLGGLLQLFLEDPDETVTGPIRVTIESALIEPRPDGVLPSDSVVWGES